MQFNFLGTRTLLLEFKSLEEKQLPTKEFALIN